MKRIFIALALLITSIVNAQETGTIAGKLLDKESNNQPLPFANVIVKGTTKGSSTDFDGLYEINDIPVGTYTIEFSFTGYQTVEIPNVLVEADKVSVVDATMGATAAALDEVIIKVVTNREREEALLLEQKNAVEIKQAIGAQELARKGVGDVEQGVTKVSGITKQESRGVIVRGLDDRYNFLTVNGLPFITGDPDKKIVPLDKFTTDLVRNVNIYKTFNQDLYGDFAGATVDIITKDIPSKSTTTINVGFNANSQTTFKDFKLDDESAAEELGIQGDNRVLPNEYDQSLVNLGFRSTPEESRNLFDTNFDFSTIDATIASSLQITHGGTSTIDEDSGKKLGYYLSFNFENDYFTIPEATESALNTQGGFNSNYEDAQTYTLSTSKSSLVSFELSKRDSYNVRLNNVFIQSTENAFEEKFGFNSEANDEFFFRSSRYRQTTINHTQLLGDFYLDSDQRSKVKWGGSFGIGRYDEPDRKILRAEGVGEERRLYTANNGNPFRFWADLDITNYNGYLEFEQIFGNQNNENNSSKLIIGGDIDVLRYDYFNRAIRLDANRSVANITLDVNNVDSYITDGFDGAYFFYEDASDASKFAEIEQNILAGYVAYNLVLDKWDFTVGLRGELSDRTIFYRLFNTPVSDDFLTETDDPFNILPTLNIKYSLNESSNLRLAGSVTNTRPRVREILPIRYDGGNFNLVTGNRELENSTNYNLDIKYEFFFEDGGLFAITGFGKYIDKPIETVLTPVAGGTSIGFANTQEAQIIGAEIEYITGLGKLLGESFEDFKLGFNGSLMYTNAKVDRNDPRQNILTNDERKLQGASPYLINADLSYNKDFSENWNSIFTIAYNVYGERIYALGGSNLDDTFEKPFNQLDFVWRNNFDNKFSLGVSVKNILDDTFQVVQTPTAVENASEIPVLEFQRGIDFSLSLGYRF
ncbi:TonB-dependent receptor [Aquimarina sp. U1-2]|uniref:TonB-dependent receptor n=1 Tax=Aquimarina sp. U1-2 TaxID=2823141 RepID=UPI001AECC8E8|nr:TonB-dependent receptor [Aquimarina sp. U1-2]MBP2831430.1 TonB-dependent receptor [Aquimarina sp. U1-2]